MLKQKLYGIAAIALGVLAATITGDSTASVLMYIIGISAIFSRENVLTLDETKKSARSYRNSYGRRGK